MHSFDDELLTRPAKAQAAPTTGPVPAEARGPAGAHSPTGIMNLQRRVGNAGVAQLLSGDDDRQSIDAATRAGGSPLGAESRVQMEAAFGADFSSVRIHTGGEADSSAKQLGAHAYTVGEDVVFANGRYEPDTPTGQRTLAHELTHVVQQRSGPVDGSDTGGGVKVSHPSDRFEQAAEVMADQVTAGRMADTGSPAGATAGPAVQRQGDDAEVQTLAVQREGEMEEEEIQTMAVQRDGEMEEEEAPATS